MTTTNDIKRLYKSRSDRMIDGICGGVAAYFGVDPTLVRVAWVLLTLLGGSGIILYIIGMIIMPVEPSTGMSQPIKHSSHTNQQFWGILLLVAGIFWLAGNLGFSLWHHWWGFSWDVLLPVVLILAGTAFLFGGRNYISNNAPQSEPVPGTAPVPESQTPKRLYRSRYDRKLFGVCGGLGNFFNIDPTLVRVIFIVSLFASFGLMLLMYIVMAVLVNEEPLVIPVS